MMNRTLLKISICIYNKRKKVISQKRHSWCVPTDREREYHCIKEKIPLLNYDNKYKTNRNQSTQTIEKAK